jgi:hypothetical protein
MGAAESLDLGAEGGVFGCEGKAHVSLRRYLENGTGLFFNRPDGS